MTNRPLLRLRLARRTLTVLAVAALAAGCATVASVADYEFSLREGDVFATITPVPFAFEEDPKVTPPLPSSGMPPMITHTVEEFLPVTVARNACRDCHDRPAAIGKPVAKGRAMPAPASHYVKDAATGALRLSGAMFTCMACHAPQTGAAPLVVNVSP